VSEQYINEPMLDMFIFETLQLIEQIEQSILNSEESSCYTQEAINEIFRIMHTIKGSAAMMDFNNISTLAHTIEDLFYFIREEKPKNVDCSALSDLFLEGVDFIMLEVEKIQNHDSAGGDASALIKSINNFLATLKQNNISTGNQSSADSKSRIDFIKQFRLYKTISTNQYRYTTVLHKQG